jgi:hypothetical protein
MTSHVIKGGSFRSGSARTIAYQEFSRHTFFLNAAGFRVCRHLSPLEARLSAYTSTQGEEDGTGGSAERGAVLCGGTSGV